MQNIIDFNLNFKIDNNSTYQFQGVAKFNPKSDKFIFDPSVLFYLTTIKLKENNYTIYIPDKMIELIIKSRESKKYKEFLSKFLLYFSFSRTKEISNNNWNNFYENISILNIKSISEEFIEDNDSYEMHRDLYQS